MREGQLDLLPSQQPAEPHLLPSWTPRRLFSTSEIPAPLDTVQQAVKAEPRREPPAQRDLTASPSIPTPSHRPFTLDLSPRFPPKVRRSKSSSSADKNLASRRSTATAHRVAEQLTILGRTTFLHQVERVRAPIRRMERPVLRESTPLCIARGQRVFLRLGWPLRRGRGPTSCARG